MTAVIMVSARLSGTATTARAQTIMSARVRTVGPRAAWPPVYNTPTKRPTKATVQKSSEAGTSVGPTATKGVRM